MTHEQTTYTITVTREEIATIAGALERETDALDKKLGDYHSECANEGKNPNYNYVRQIKHEREQARQLRNEFGDLVGIRYMGTGA